MTGSAAAGKESFEVFGQYLTGQNTGRNTAFFVLTNIAFSIPRMQCTTSKQDMSVYIGGIQPRKLLYCDKRHLACSISDDNQPFSFSHASEDVGRELAPESRRLHLSICQLSAQKHRSSLSDQ